MRVSVRLILEVAELTDAQYIQEWAAAKGYKASVEFLSKGKWVSADTSRARVTISDKKPKKFLTKEEAEALQKEAKAAKYKPNTPGAVTIKHRLMKKYDVSDNTFHNVFTGQWKPRKGSNGTESTGTNGNKSGIRSAGTRRRFSKKK
jgi:hypothetical protein